MPSAGRLLVAAALALGFVACASPGSDIHLAPFYTRIATGDGRIETETLAGLYRRRNDALTGAFEQVTVGPFWSKDDLGGGDWRSHYLVPLGYSARHGERSVSILLPVYFWGSGPDSNGDHEWKLVSLPGFLFRSTAAHGTEFGWFPFWGRFEGFLTFDELTFVAFPLYVYARRGERVSRHFLYPVLGWTTGGKESSYHLWPLYGKATLEGRYDRRYLLWPIFHRIENDISGYGEERESIRMALPLIGRNKRGTYRATTVLWPFFGYASDPEEDFWALDAPWPLVRIQRSENVHRTRFWPFYSYLEAGSLEATNFLWPIVHLRKERYFDAQRDSVWIIPLWQSWDRVDLVSGAESSWRKLFPLFQLERRDAWERGSFPTLDPFQRNQLIDRHYSWIWKLWEWEREGELRRERSWGGLWRRERDAGEDRKSLSGIWAKRKYRSSGRRVRETSLLFGLVRWRVTEGEGFDMLRPAFPGPGWPAERATAGGLGDTRGAD